MNEPVRCECCEGEGCELEFGIGPCPQCGRSGRVWPSVEGEVVLGVGGECGTLIELVGGERYVITAPPGYTIIVRPPSPQQEGQ